MDAIYRDRCLSSRLDDGKYSKDDPQRNKNLQIRKFEP